VRNSSCMPAALCDSILAKIHEQIDRTDHLIGMLPAEGIHWTPSIERSWSTAKLLGHLLECLAGFCAVLAAVDQEKLAHFNRLKQMPVNHECTALEARDRIAIYRQHIDEGFELLRDEHLSRTVPTVFVESGETVLTLLMGNLEHLINHKHELFTYLKSMGVKVRTKDLYRFRL